MTNSLFEHSAELVRSWAGMKTGDTDLQHLLSVDEVSLWELIAPSLAVYTLPEVLARSSGQKLSPSESILRRLKPYLKWLRDWLREAKETRDAETQAHYRMLFPSGKLSRILMLSFEPRQIEALEPIIKVQPLARESAEIVVLGTKYQQPKPRFLDPQGWRYITVEDLFHRDITRQVKENRRRLRLTLRGLLRDRSFQENLAFQGAPLWPHLKDDFQDLSLHVLPQLVKMLALAENVMRTEKPDIVVGTDDCDPRARAFFLVARKLGVPTLHVQYGLASPQSVNWQFTSTDRAAIFDEGTLQLLTGMGLKGNRLAVTGHPRFDRLMNRGGARERVGSVLKIDPTRKVILFTSQPYVAGSFPSAKVREQLISDVYGSVAGLGEAMLVVKPHPDEELGLHHRLRAKASLGAVMVVDRDFDTQELILACDILVSFASTTMLEAVIADKPVVMMEIPDSPVSAQYATVAGLVAKSPEELASAFTAILNDEGMRKKLQVMRQAFLSRQKYLDGKASHRVADLILEMIAERRHEAPKGKS